MSAEESIFLADETLGAGGGFLAPARNLWIGAHEPGAVPGGFPEIFLDWNVAVRLQAEGQRSIREDREVAGILLGTASADSRQIRVSHIAVARDEDSSPVHFKFSYSVWDDLIDQMEELSQGAGERLLLLGWYHTHPNMAVFLSRYDLRTHRDFHRPYQFALVLAPRLGTTECSVGFFVNRGDPPPLLGGIRLYGGGDDRDVGAELPWRFQVEEAEGIEEGEREPRGDAAAISAERPRTFQLGVVRGEDPSWFVLGEDAAEGPVLSILEGMAATVVEQGVDRLGVLLGAANADRHITITRVRFLGHLGQDGSREREALLWALAFLAESFPAAGETKILGVVRIVAPQRFSAGDRFDPIEHNVGIAEYLQELRYDPGANTFQVGLLLYPGIEEEVISFQVLAQLGKAAPLVKTSLQAVAPASLRANERYEPIAGKVLEIEQAPCLKVPNVGVRVPRAVEIDPTRPESSRPELPRPADPKAASVVPSPPASEADGEVRRAPPLGARRRRGGQAGPVLLGVAVVLVAVLGVLLAGRPDPVVPAPSPADDGTQVRATTEGVSGAAYQIGPFRCGAAGVGGDCDPFGGERTKAELFRLQIAEPYTRSTTVPPEAFWVQPFGEPKQLVRRRDGDWLVFEIDPEGAAWSSAWPDRTTVAGEIVVAPRGEPPRGGGEFPSLRHVAALRLVAPPLPPVPEATPIPVVAERTPAPSAAPVATWASGGTRAKARWDLGRRAFVDVPDVSVVTERKGDWSLSVRFSKGGGPFAKAAAAPPPTERDNMVPIGRALTELLRRTASEAALAGPSGKGAKELTATVRPPGGPDLQLSITLEGSLPAPRIRHRICMVIVGEDGNSVPGQVSVAGGEWFRTWEVQGGTNECMDGGRSGRWREIEIDSTAPELRYQQLSDDPAMATWRGRDQRVSLRAWAGVEGGARCLVLVARVDGAGVQKQSATVTPVARYVDGTCK